MKVLLENIIDILKDINYQNLNENEMNLIKQIHDITHIKKVNTDLSSVLTQEEIEQLLG